ncbi:MAG TPA: hypothetical protein VMU39_17045 [Solirubrobacteraceae bacterium]|nr:hypothetical protein [Solirubrobacteraceae bacterium]
MSRAAFKSRSRTFVDPVEGCVDVVVLGVAVAAGERLVAAGREPAHLVRRELGRRPGARPRWRGQAVPGGSSVLVTTAGPW